MCLKIKTGIGVSFNELFFRDSAGANNHDEYLFESTFDQITCDVVKTKSRVTLSTSHTLKVDDVISLKINPSLKIKKVKDGEQKKYTTKKSVDKKEQSSHQNAAAAALDSIEKKEKQERQIIAYLFIEKTLMKVF